MEYKFREIEKKWQDEWAAKQAYKVSNSSSKPKCYVLDMFPYPSGAGLHVGHPLGYISSDIYSRYKRLKGFNVLHPMGYDAFGLPAEQYAIEHGIHPEISTENNINNFRAQLDKIGFSYDWDREVNTSKPDYYKWTQWIFLQLFNSWFNRASKKAEPIATLVKIFETDGSATVNYHLSSVNPFSATEWQAFDEKTKQGILMNFRLAYCGFGEVNWCEALGTVLANDEVVNGVSERGGHPVVKKKLRQWYLRITEYADRLLEGLQTVDFSEAMKEMQTNWIGKSSGAEITFNIASRKSENVSELANNDSQLTVYTTRPDTIFGVDFMVIAPELDWIPEVVSAEQQQAVDDYLTYVKSRSDRERQAEKKISGVFTGAYAVNPFNGREIPIWISEYVLAGYGTGAIMAVPCGDERDFKFANHFVIPITNILGNAFNGTEPNATKDAILSNSDFLNGVNQRKAIDIVIDKLEAMGIGKRKTNFKMRDAAFSRQRYWGEPFPIVWKDGVAYPLPETELPLELPTMDDIKPGINGDGPLSNNIEWLNDTDKYFTNNEGSSNSPLGVGGGNLESSTMPGYAGSSWYFLRYMDPHNTEAFASRQATDYWNQVDLYIGGTEHAVGHLLYSRMWTKALYDLGFIGFDEPFKKLLNQGMITGSSRFVYRLETIITHSGQTLLWNNCFSTPVFFSEGIKKILLETYFSKEQKENLLFETIFKRSLWSPSPHEIKELNFSKIHVDVNIVDGVELDIEACKKYKNGEYANAEFILEDGKYICGVETEKMSKSKLNTVNPDDLVYKFGADTFRMYEMFLGPVDQSKPWDTKGIEGVHRFLKKLWRLFFDDKATLSFGRGAGGEAGKVWNEQEPTAEELKILHKTIKKIEDDTERFSFNTAVSAFMVCVNELSDVKCNKRAILEPLLILLVPYAPHIAEELWSVLGNTSLIIDAEFPVLNAQFLIESSKEYPISINGKVRANITIALDAEQAAVEEIVLANDTVQKWLEGKAPKKIIFVKNRMINIVP